MLTEVVYADDLFLISERNEGFRNKFLKWKEAFGSKSLKANLGKTKVIVSGGMTMDGLFKLKVFSC